MRCSQGVALPRLIDGTPVSTLPPNTTNERMLEWEALTGDLSERWMETTPVNTQKLAIRNMHGHHRAKETRGGTSRIHTDRVGWISGSVLLAALPGYRGLVH